MVLMIETNGQSLIVRKDRSWRRTGALAVRSNPQRKPVKNFDSRSFRQSLCSTEKQRCTAKKIVDVGSADRGTVCSTQASAHGVTVFRPSVAYFRE
jgi:hypothetical protein